MNNCSMLVYTHSSFEDILDVTLKRFKKYAANLPLSICSDKIDIIARKYATGYNIGQLYKYDDTLDYQIRLVSVLEQLGTKYVCLHHDNNCLYNFLNIDTMNGLLERMDKSEMDSLRLSHVGINFPKDDTSDIITYNTGPYIYSVWPTIWNRETLLYICRILKKPYKECESPECQNLVRQFNNYYLCKSVKDTYTTIYQATSDLYPSVHYTSSGRWYCGEEAVHCLPEMKEKVFDIIREYHIDSEKRTIF
jgi:hypothetical protein